MDTLQKIFRIQRTKARRALALSVSWISSMVFLIAITAFLWISSVIINNNDNIFFLSKTSSILRGFDSQQRIISEDDIMKIEEQRGIRFLSPVSQSDFNIYARINFQGQVLGTELFFETVEEAYQDFEFPETNENTIPIVIGSSFLNLFNIAYGPTRGLPEIAPELLSLVPLNFQVQNGTKIQTYQGTIVGVSDRYQSVLIPRNKFEAIRSNLGMTTPVQSFRALIEINTSLVDLNHINDLGYHLESSQVPFYEIFQQVQIASITTAVIMILFLLLGNLVSIQSIQIIILQSDHDIKLLMSLGYPDLEITKTIQTSGWIYDALALGLSIVITAILLVVLPQSIGLFTPFFWAVISLIIIQSLLWIGRYMYSKKLIRKIAPNPNS